ncbi:MAG: DUF417 family protein [Thermodesulfobacteriota bacterium]
MQKNQGEAVRVKGPGQPEKHASEECPVTAVMINEAQLVLAEKRTSLAVLRTGIAVFLLPLSVLSFLVATSELYSFDQVWPLLVPLLTVCTALIFLGAYLVIRAVVRIRNHERILEGLKRKNKELASFLD